MPKNSKSNRNPALSKWAKIIGSIATVIFIAYQTVNHFFLHTAGSSSEKPVALQPAPVVQPQNSQPPGTTVINSTGSNGIVVGTMNGGTINNGTQATAQNTPKSN